MSYGCTLDRLARVVLLINGRKCASTRMRWRMGNELCLWMVPSTATQNLVWQATLLKPWAAFVKHSLAAPQLPALPSHWPRCFQQPGCCSSKRASLCRARANNLSATQILKSSSWILARQFRRRAPISRVIFPQLLPPYFVPPLGAWPTWIRCGEDNICPKELLPACFASVFVTIPLSALSLPLRPTDFAPVIKATLGWHSVQELWGISSRTAVVPPPAKSKILPLPIPLLPSGSAIFR